MRNSTCSCFFYGIAPEFLIDGQLSTVHSLVDKWQYDLMKDMVYHNIGEPMSEFKRPEGKVVDPVLQVR